MTRTGVLNPHLKSLLCRIRHTSILVIAYRGFPCWLTVETIVLSLIDGIPLVTQVLDALLAE